MKNRSVLAQRAALRVLMISGALVALVLAPGAARAASGATEFGVDVGVTDLSDNTANDSGTRFGLRGGYRILPWFGLEGQASRTSADDAGLDARLDTLFVNGVFSFRPETRFEPYLLSGIGRANLKLGIAGSGNDIDDSGVAYQVGAGSRIYLNGSRDLALRFEVTRLHERSFNDGSDYNNVTTGLTWRPGHKR